MAEVIAILVTHFFSHFFSLWLVRTIGVHVSNLSIWAAYVRDTEAVFTRGSIFYYTPRFIIGWVCLNVEELKDFQSDALYMYVLMCEEDYSRMSLLDTYCN